MLTPNQQAERLLNRKIESTDAVKGAVDLCNRGGLKAAIITMGDGVAFSEDETGARLPAFEVDAVDTVAAGDCFNLAHSVRWCDHAGIDFACDARRRCPSQQLAPPIQCQACPQSKFLETAEFKKDRYLTH